MFPRKVRKILAECPDLVVLAGGEMTRTQEKICHIMDAASAAVAAAAAAASGQPGMVTNAYSFPFTTWPRPFIRLYQVPRRNMRF